MAMTWSIEQVARVSGVTARTLRYYDEIGLLRPDSLGSNGYRYYERQQLSRLHQILLLRELGLDLASIRAVVDAEHHPVEALRGHHRRLLEECRRLDRLPETVAATIKHFEDGTDMPAEDLYEGFEFSSEYIDRELQRTKHPELGNVKNRTAACSETTSSPSTTRAFNSNIGCSPCSEPAFPTTMRPRWPCLTPTWRYSVKSGTPTKPATPVSSSAPAVRPDRSA